MNKYLIEILTALAIVVIVLLLVRMYALESAGSAAIADETEPEETPAETPAETPVETPAAAEE